jgi:diacylglycerol diphosphate phosphatase/phosphatidate phosphatase
MTAKTPPHSSTPPPKHPPLPDLEANQPNKPSHRRDAFIPGFRNPPPFFFFLRHNWYDIATQLLCLLTALMLYSYVPPIMPRHFPLYPGVEKSAWGMKHSQPYLREYVDTMLSAVISFVIPAAIMGGIALWGTRKFEDGNAAVRV